MTAHELARQLLTGPDKPVQLRDSSGFCSEIGDVTPIVEQSRPGIVVLQSGDMDEEDESDDLCDLCMSSGVSVVRTTYCGKTIGVQCGCDDAYEDGTCGDDGCETCAEMLADDASATEGVVEA